MTSAVNGYEEVEVHFTVENWGGIEKGNPETSLMDGSVGTGDWFYAVGSVRLESEEIPGPGHGVDKVELYVIVPTVCDDTCSTCSANGASDCLTCSGDLVLDGSTCVESCPHRKFSKDRICELCSDDCKTC